MKHTLPNPFPFEVGQKVKSIVTDERCTCGKLRTEHADNAQYGHGPAFDGSCPQFTWATFIWRDKRFPYYTDSK